MTIRTIVFKNYFPSANSGDNIVPKNTGVVGTILGEQAKISIKKVPNRINLNFIFCFLLG